MLKDSAREFLEINSPLESFRTLRDNDYKPYDHDVWKGFVEMGWTALIIPEKYGGLDFGYTGLGQIIEETGRTLTKSPIISSILAFKLDEEHSSISQLNETPSPNEKDPCVPLD